MDCEACKQPMVILDLNDPDKPLRCSDACPENRRSIAERGVSVTEKEFEDSQKVSKKKK